MRLPAPLASLTAALAGAVLLAGCGSEGSGPNTDTGAVEGAAPEGLRVTEAVTGLTQPWDVKPVPGVGLLVTERETKRLLVVRDGQTEPTPVDFAADTVWASGETGLMSLQIDPDFASTRRFWTCQGGNTSGGGHDIRVLEWTLDEAATKATLVGPLLTGIETVSGRHGGCRMLIDPAGSMYVGTGDAAVGTNPQDLTSLNGKVLRLDPETGDPWPQNPMIDAANRTTRYIVSYGHRNIQGLAQRDDGTIWTAEHGPDRDDEVNRDVPGGDYGWNPVPGYGESVPMTDQSLPGKQVEAAWSSGVPTIATSGADFVHGRRWGELDGALAVAALKGSRVLFLLLDDQGTLTGERIPTELTTYGRLRSVTSLDDGDLLVTTANGSDDKVLRVSPPS